MKTGLPSTVPGMSARTRLGSVYIRMHLLLHLVGGVGQVDRVAVALAHLLVAVEPRQPRRTCVSSGCGSTSTSPEEIVEAADDLARQLQVRDLILADRHEARVVDGDVGRLQQRIAEEADRRQVLVLQRSPAAPCRSARARATAPARPSTAAGTARRARARATGRRTCSSRDRARRQSSRRRCRRRTTSAGWCRRSRWSARASRRRSRSSRTASCSGTQLPSAPTRWPRCRRPVGRMPDTTRGLRAVTSWAAK